MKQPKQEHGNLEPTFLVIAHSYEELSKVMVKWDHDSGMDGLIEWGEYFENAQSIQEMEVEAQLESDTTYLQ